MKTEKIIASWSGAVLMILGYTPQLKNETIKMVVICSITAFTIFLFAWSLCKRKENEKR